MTLAAPPPWAGPPVAAPGFLADAVSAWTGAGKQAGYGGCDLYAVVDASVLSAGPLTASYGGSAGETPFSIYYSANFTEVIYPPKFAEQAHEAYPAPPVMVDQDGTVVRGSGWSTLLAIPGESCFYELRAQSHADSGTASYWLRKIAGTRL